MSAISFLMLGFCVELELSIITLKLTHTVVGIQQQRDFLDYAASACALQSWYKHCLIFEQTILLALWGITQMRMSSEKKI